MTHRTLPDSLARARASCVPRLREVSDRLSPGIRTVVAYHLGWIDEDGVPSDHGGKAVRPALALLSARAAGASEDAGVDGGVAVELVHNFSLVHDDIMDRDRERHHRPTAWALFGDDRAILAGDALVTLALQVLLRPPTPERVRAASVLTDATMRMIEGQSEDLALEGRDDVTVDECLAMISRKTAALLACASAIGAVLAGAADELVSHLHAFGEHVGMAFQAVDDQLGIWGRPELTGKPVYGDLRQRKNSLPVAAALADGAAAATELRELLTRGNGLTESELARAAALVEEAGGRAWAAREADRRLELALSELDRAGIAADVRDELAEVARFIVVRDF